MDASMAKALPPRFTRSSIVTDRLLSAAAGATLTLLLCWAFAAPNAVPGLLLQSPLSTKLLSKPYINPNASAVKLVVRDTAAEKTLSDDPVLPFTIDRPIEDWDAKRGRWLRRHPSFLPGAAERVVMVSGSQHGPCRNPVGDHLLLRFYKNKADYCRAHGHDLFYNTALLDGSMPGCWAKLPLVRAAMAAHPEAEWIWWVDEDAAFTDLAFRPPLGRYRAHNLVVPGWPYMVFEAKSWVGLNAGVFLLRNCQWSLDLLAAWACMGPQTPDHKRWGEVLLSELTGKPTADSDDQSALVYLIIKQKARWADKIFIESGYDLHGFWKPIVGKLENMSRDAAELRRPVEKASVGHGMAGEEHGEAARPPFVTHFAGCQPCSGGHNPAYSWSSCYEGMQRALNFADEQVLRKYGFARVGLLDNVTTVRALAHYSRPA